MKHELEIGMENKDGADQGFLAGYFPDLLDQPMFHPPPNGSKLNGKYRLPLGYQMDASYYCKYMRKNWDVMCYINCWSIPLRIVSFQPPVLHSADSKFFLSVRNLHDLLMLFYLFCRS